MTQQIKLSDQQYQIVSTLWTLGSATAREVQKALTGKPLAHTTVGTILTRLEKKGVLTSTTRGRERLFSPLVSENEVQRSMVSSMVSTLFHGNSKELLVHLVKEGEINADELADIKNLIDSHATDEEDGHD